jgi:predicted molibdopterin-dependent oxidoreductase YjgC
MMTSNGEIARARRQELTILVNGQSVSVLPGVTVAAAVMQAGVPFRRSVSGQPRSALCGMGICEECRATVNGAPHVRSCQRIVAAGMEIVTG